MQQRLNTNEQRPIQGAGIGLRSCHYDYILENKPNIAWFEALSDNYLNDHSSLSFLEHIRKDYPIALHGVGMSLGSTDPLNWDYFKKLKQLAKRIQPQIISDHLSWISVNKQYLHDLLPLPMTQAVIDHVSSRIMQVQDFLGTRILIENPSTYFEYECSEMPEWAFINAIIEKADCYLLLDVNNVYVSATNHEFDPYDYLNHIDSKRVKQFHMAGYADKKNYLFDTHGETIHPPVWALYKAALKCFGAIPTLIERDDNIPPFEALYKEAQQAQQLMDAIG